MNLEEIEGVYAEKIQQQVNSNYTQWDEAHCAMKVIQDLCTCGEGEWAMHVQIYDLYRSSSVCAEFVLIVQCDLSFNLYLP